MIEGNVVPHYLIQASYSPEGARGLLKEGGTGRRDAVQQIIETVGGKLHAFYFAFGETDAYLIVEAPSDKEMAAVSLTVAASGAATLKTSVLLTPEQVDEARTVSVAYRPPGA